MCSVYVQYFCENLVTYAQDQVVTWYQIKELNVFVLGQTTKDLLFATDYLMMKLMVSQLQTTTATFCTRLEHRVLEADRKS